MKWHLFYVLMDRTSPIHEYEKCLNTNAKSVFKPYSVRSEGRTSRSPVLQALIVLFRFKMLTKIPKPDGFGIFLSECSICFRRCIRKLYSNTPSLNESKWANFGVKIFQYYFLRPYVCSAINITKYCIPVYILIQAIVFPGVQIHNSSPIVLLLNHLNFSLLH